MDPIHTQIKNTLDRGISPTWATCNSSKLWWRGRGVTFQETRCPPIWSTRWLGVMCVYEWYMRHGAIPDVVDSSPHGSVEVLIHSHLFGDTTGASTSYRRGDDAILSSHTPSLRSTPSQLRTDISSHFLQWATWGAPPWLWSSRETSVRDSQNSRGLIGK